MTPIVWLFSLSPQCPSSPKSPVPFLSSAKKTNPFWKFLVRFSTNSPQTPEKLQMPTGDMNGKTESITTSPVNGDAKIKNGTGNIPKNNNNEIGLITAKIKEDFIDAKQGPESGVFSKMKSNLVDVIVCNAVGPHNFCVRDS